MIEQTLIDNDILIKLKDCDIIHIKDSYDSRDTVPSGCPTCGDVPSMVEYSVTISYDKKDENGSDDFTIENSEYGRNYFKVFNVSSFSFFILINFSFFSNITRKEFEDLITILFLDNEDYDGNSYTDSYRRINNWRDIIKGHIKNGLNFNVKGIQEYLEEFLFSEEK